MSPVYDSIVGRWLRMVRESESERGAMNPEAKRFAPYAALDWATTPSRVSIPLASVFDRGEPDLHRLVAGRALAWLANGNEPFERAILLDRWARVRWRYQWRFIRLLRRRLAVTPRA